MERSQNIEAESKVRYVGSKSHLFGLKGRVISRLNDEDGKPTDLFIVELGCCKALYGLTPAVMEVIE